MENTIIENWFTQEKVNEDYSIKKNEILQIISNHCSNFRILVSIANRFDIPIVLSKNDNIEISISDLNDCLLFNKLNLQGCDFFNRSLIQYGYIEKLDIEWVLSIDIMTYESWKEFKAIFNRIDVDLKKMPLFSGLAMFVNHQFDDDEQEIIFYYFGSIVKNTRTGIGLFKYSLPISTSYYWKECGGDHGYESRYTIYHDIYYFGQWLDNCKHGIGILGPLHNEYKIEQYYLIGKWEQNKLVEIFRKNDVNWNDIVKLVNFNYFGNNSVDTDAKISLKNINDLINIEPLLCKFLTLE